MGPSHHWRRDGAGLVHQVWFWTWVRLFLIVAHEGWAAAVSDARHSDITWLSIRLSLSARQPADFTGAHPTAEPATGRRPRPSRPSGLRAAGPTAPRRPA